MTGKLIAGHILLPDDPSSLALDESIIEASTLVEAARLHRSEQSLRLRASDILRSARRRAVSIRSLAEQDANQRVQLACAEQAQGMDALAATLADAMGDMVQAVLEELLIEDPEERARLCAVLARQTLQRELGAVVRGHPEDLAILTDLPTMQGHACEPDPTMPRGILSLRTGHGRVEVDPARLLQTLCVDLRRHLATSRDSRRASSFPSHPS